MVHFNLTYFIMLRLNSRFSFNMLSILLKQTFLVKDTARARVYEAAK